MGPRWHSDPLRSARVRKLARAMPVIFCFLGIVYAAERIFPTRTVEGFMVISLFLAGLGASVASRKLAPPVQRVEGADPAARVIDEETGLGNRLLLMKTLATEVARSKRYGSMSSLAVIETRVVGADAEDPSMAPVARTLVKQSRMSDGVYRLDLSRFVVVLTETTRQGAEIYLARTLRSVASKPFARTATGTPLYVACSGTAIPWTDDLASADDYLDALLIAHAENNARPTVRLAG